MLPQVCTSSAPVGRQRPKPSVGVLRLPPVHHQEHMQCVVEKLCDLYRDGSEMPHANRISIPLRAKHFSTRGTRPPHLLGDTAEAH